jgi:membrane fusion protein (multidrug efflux system)
MTKVFKMIAGFVVLAICLTSCDRKQEGGKRNDAPRAYPTMIVGTGDVVLESVYPVTIKGKEDIDIRPRIDGFIEAIYIDEGSVVKAGQTLFKINSPQAEQALNTAQAAVIAAQAQVNTAKLNVERIRPLAEKGIVSNVQLATYQNALESAEAAKTQAEATLKNAKATLSWTNVTSPVNGLVGSIPYRIGSLVNNQNVLTTVANISKVYAYFSLNEKTLTEFMGQLEGNTQVEKLKNAPELTLTLADGTVYPRKGRIETITGVVNTTTGSAGLRAEFPNDEGLLRSGTSGKISIPRDMKNALIIPQKATFAKQDKVLVYIVQGDSVVQKSIAVLPTPDSRSYVVTGGMNESDRIVTDGLASLSHGRKIIVE